MRPGDLGGAVDEETDREGSVKCAVVVTLVFAREILVLGCDRWYLAAVVVSTTVGWAIGDRSLFCEKASTAPKEVFILYLVPGYV